MFTGLIEAVGEVAALRATPEGTRLTISTSLAPALALGDSLAVNGVCLTVVAQDLERVEMDVSPETSRVTTLGGFATGKRVNLERPLRADARLGGHFVQGHVDATGTIAEFREDGDSYWLSVAFPPALAPYIVHKGSVAVDGISLTVAAVDASHFGVQIIPYTWEQTNLRTARADDTVNIETDILGKYVARALDLRLHANAGAEITRQTQP